MGTHRVTSEAIAKAAEVGGPEVARILYQDIGRPLPDPQPKDPNAAHGTYDTRANAVPEGAEAPPSEPETEPAPAGEDSAAADLGSDEAAVGDSGSPNTLFAG